MAASGDGETASKNESDRKVGTQPPCCGCGGEDCQLSRAHLPERLNTASLCLQCAKCSGLCPAARVEPTFNPRSLVLSLLNGTSDGLLTDDSPIWACCVCLSCDEYCPQDVKPHEVVVYLRNEACRRGGFPKGASLTVGRVRESGVSVAVGRGLKRRREALHLPDFLLTPVDTALFLDEQSE